MRRQTRLCVAADVEGAYSAVGMNRFDARRRHSVAIGRSLPARRGAPGWLSAVLVAPLLCAACAPLQPRPDGFANFDVRVRGRIGVRGGGEAFAGSFDWRQAGDRFAIALWGPLGQGRTRLIGDDRSVRLIDARGRVREDVDANALLLRAIGWRAPVAALRHWVRGRVAPDAAAELERDANGRLTRFQQFGWTVELRGWRSTAAGDAPARIVATKDGRRVTVICKEWFGPSSGREAI